MYKGIADRYIYLHSCMYSKRNRGAYYVYIVCAKVCGLLLVLSSLVILGMDEWLIIEELFKSPEDKDTGDSQHS